MRIYSVYAKFDDLNRLVAVDSNRFLSYTTGWIKIDEGSGDRYSLAQGNYFPYNLTDDRCIYRYVMAQLNSVQKTPVCVFDHDGMTYGIFERTTDEMDEDYVEPEPGLSTEERIAALEEQNAQLLEQNEMLTECLLEMSMIVYA